jgi:hypothetical protein
MSLQRGRAAVSGIGQDDERPPIEQTERVPLESGLVLAEEGREGL